MILQLILKKAASILAIANNNKNTCCLKQTTAPKAKKLGKKTNKKANSKMAGKRKIIDNEQRLYDGDVEDVQEFTKIEKQSK